MSKMGKLKGKRGEYEFNGILERHLGERLQTNPHAQGADNQTIPGLSIEVKRQETLVVNVWWKQALRQAEENNDIAVLAYRRNRTKWRVCLPAYLITLRDKDGYIEMSLETFLMWLDDWVSKP